MNTKLKQTYWTCTESNTKLTLEQVLSFSQNIKPTLIKHQDLTHLRTVKCSIDRVETANTSFPIIVLQHDGLYCRILDGHHRLQKSIRLGNTNILAKVIQKNKTPSPWQSLLF